MIINNEHKFGLSDLYQLRGRIGRGSNKGKAFLLIPNQEISETAKKRLNAIRKLTRLGSGFNIAMEDLEIRGAGNLFGTQQSGNIFDVGIEFYLELLEKEINNIKDTAMNEEEEVEVIANQNIYIPDNYIESAERRLYYYKKISLIGSTNDSLELLEELLDKFGVIPNQVQNLIYITLIKIESQRLGIYKLIFKKESVIFLSKKIKKIKEFQVEIKKIAINPPEIYKLLSETINIENMLKSNYEIVDGRFIINLN
jgi:transcription-repair coupling factor (superfamily II helicase)